jgi:hypothetical protein
MKTKKILFELIEMNTSLYNVLYTVLCVVVLVLIFIYSAIATGGLIKIGWITKELGEKLYLPNIAILYFIGYKLLNKNNYT